MKTISVYAESTPNPATIKFVADKLFLENGTTAEYNSSEAAKDSPLALQIFNFPFVSGVFISANFISVTKNNLADWADVTMELREFIRDYLSSGKQVFTARKQQEQNFSGEEKTIPQTETEKKIMQVLEEYVRPAVEQDGGAIHFKSYENGILKVILRGSCSGCPSSAITLKAGIEGLFQRMLPEVKEVVNVSDNF